MSDIFGSVDGSRASKTRQWYTVPVSMAAHLFLLAALIVTPLVVTGAIPLPTSVLVFAAPAPPPPVPPPVVTSTLPPPTPAVAPDPSLAPVVAPRGLAPEPPPSLPPLVRIEQPTDVGPVGAGPALAAPPATSPPQGPIPVGGDVRPPRRLHDAPPSYPPIARSARIEGDVVLQATISKDGSVIDVHVLKSIPLLDDAARAAVRQWRYSTPTLNGQPIDVLMTVTVRFRLQ